MPECIFCKIVAGEIPATTVYQDDQVIAFEDLNPHAPTHVLIIPRKHVASLTEATPEDEGVIGHLNLIAAKIAGMRNITSGYRTVFNNGPGAGQSVFHLHLHLLGGRSLSWPPG